MEILEVDVKGYTDFIISPYHAFGGASFNDLNKHKCDKVFYLLFKNGKYRLGIIGGIRDGIFYSPYSAPFGGFSYISEDIRIQNLEGAVELLEFWAKEKGFSSIKIILPPPIYEGSFIAKQVNCLWRAGFRISGVDLNYSYDLNIFDDNYPEFIWYNARKNLRISLNSGLQFKVCYSEDEKKLAYDIISKNRESRGFPLRMLWQQVYDTVQIISADFFLVTNDKQTPVASAIVFHVSSTIVQVVYWGDIQGYSEIKPMNYLSYKVFEHFKSIGMKAVDIGPSSENSVPNYGLCEFKEGIGCKIDLKYTFTKDLR
jgi:hypothetical protein